MLIDYSKLPDPKAPVSGDAYSNRDGSRLVVLFITDPFQPVVVWYAHGGVKDEVGLEHFGFVLASLDMRPLGRIVADNPEAAPTKDPDEIAYRLVRFGPTLRRIREQYGLTMGDLARAVGCPPACARTRAGPRWSNCSPRPPHATT